MNPLETYLKEMRDIHSTGAAVEETSYYAPLSNLFNEIGKAFKPKVRCIINPKNQGAGLPDGGFFTSDQFQKSADVTPKDGQLPSRGAMEVKGPADNVERIAKTKQVKGYLGTYGLVLVTNYRDFLLIGRDTYGNTVEMERFTLANSETEFWQAAASPRKTAEQLGDRFCEYIKRVLLSSAPLTDPKDVAWFLASYARDALVMVEQKKDLPALAHVREALEEALGMKFTDRKGEHFFRSTLVQTLFYGVFSAWVLWHREHPSQRDTFDWRTAGWSLHVPFIKALYEQVATPTQLGDLGLVEVLDWVAGALNRVDRDAFFRKFQDDHAVQYFYEPFLEAYDPKLRKEMGVWYTPSEIVQYQVARVDTVLREELGIEDGLADESVVVLDPCCGTGAYLVEVLNHIAQTLQDKGGDALLASDLKKAAIERVFGFELMPAPFVVSHLQLGLKLRELGAPLSANTGERVGVYLTNALTGWEPAEHPKLYFKELAEERDAAEHVKRDEKVIVILGNPPYNAFAGVSPDEEQGLVEPYKGAYYTEKPGKNGKIKRTSHYLLNEPVAKGGWGIRKFNLDDLYVRFFRIAERRIAEMTGRGVVSFISNFSYLSDPSFVIMRERFLEEFDCMWFDCMNGDSRETGKLTPDGKPDPSVFSTEYNREGIRVGTTIGVAVRKPVRQDQPTVAFRHFWGAAKRQELLASLDDADLNVSYTPATPDKDNRYSFRPENVSADYKAWPSMVELSAEAPVHGPVERRAGALIDIDKTRLEKRMKAFLDPSVSSEEIASKCYGLSKKSSGYDPDKGRKRAIEYGPFDPTNVVKYLVKPLDQHWCYYTLAPTIWSRPCKEIFTQAWKGNLFIGSRPTGAAVPEGPPLIVSSILPDYQTIVRNISYFPVQLAPTGEAKGGATGTMFAAEPKANLSEKARGYLAGVGLTDVDSSADEAAAIWLHALAIGYSPLYLAENADGVRRDWPRIPLPNERAMLDTSVAMGSQVAGLLDTEAKVAGVTSGKIGPLFKTLGVLSKAGGGVLNPNEDLAVTAGWGHTGRAGATMPGQGELVQRDYDGTELVAIAEAAESRGMTQEQALGLLGSQTLDVYLNDKAYWKNVPINVWTYYIGGYQVIKKWLSYREKSLLGRDLLVDEAREVTAMARRLAAIVLLQTELDANYSRVKAAAYAWPKDAEGTGVSAP